jgi:hypothetical protein
MDALVKVILSGGRMATEAHNYDCIEVWRVMARFGASTGLVNRRVYDGNTQK